jgi:hypothetical protein
MRQTIVHLPKEGWRPMVCHWLLSVTKQGKSVEESLFLALISIVRD